MRSSSATNCKRRCYRWKGSGDCAPAPDGISSAGKTQKTKARSVTSTPCRNFMVPQSEACCVEQAIAQVEVFLFAWCMSIDD